MSEKEKVVLNEKDFDTKEEWIAAVWAALKAGKRVCFEAYYTPEQLAELGFISKQ